MSKAPTSSETGERKKPYRTPTLRSYGNVHQITKAGTTPGAHDDIGGGQAHKTGLVPQ